MTTTHENVCKSNLGITSMTPVTLRKPRDVLALFRSLQHVLLSECRGHRNVDAVYNRVVQQGVVPRAKVTGDVTLVEMGQCSTQCGKMVRGRERLSSGHEEN